MSDIKFKEIRPGMVIHCPTEENAKQLLEHLDGLGYEWSSRSEKLSERTNYGVYGENTCYLIEQCMEVMFSSINSLKSEGYEVTEFSDLIEPELTPEEAIRLQANLCHSNGCFKGCPIGKIKTNQSCNEFRRDNPEKVTKVLRQWKADHEKKEPEVEWVDICRIIETLPDGRKRCVYEEEVKSELPHGGDEKEKVEEVLKRYCKEHKGSFFAVHEVVCREKAVN